jgi:hypothetical protein
VAFWYFASDPEVVTLVDMIGVLRILWMGFAWDGGKTVGPCQEVELTYVLICVVDGSQPLLNGGVFREWLDCEVLFQRCDPPCFVRE